MIGRRGRADRPGSVDDQSTVDWKGKLVEAKVDPVGRLFEVAAAYFDERGWPFTLIDGPDEEDAGSNESSRVLA